MIHIYLHPDEDKFVREYAKNNYLTVAELIRGWIHECMKWEGHDIKEPYLTEQKSKEGRK